MDKRKNDGNSRSRMSPGSQWNYPGLSEPHVNQLSTVQESLFYMRQQSTRYFLETSDPPHGTFSDGTSHQGNNILAASADVKRTPSNLSKYLYTCHTCGKEFNRKYRFMDHVNAHNKIKAHTCPKCSKHFTFTSDVRRHLRNGVCTKYT